MKEATVLYRLNNQLKKLKENVHFSVQELQKRNAQYGGHFSDGKKAINDDYLLILSLASEIKPSFSIGIAVNYKNKSFDEQTVTASFCKVLSYKKQKTYPFEEIPDKKAIYYSQEYSYEQFRKKLNDFVSYVGCGVAASLLEKDFCKIMEIRNLSLLNEDEVEQIQAPLIKTIHTLETKQSNLYNKRQEKSNIVRETQKKCTKEFESLSEYKEAEALRKNLRELEEKLFKKKQEIYEPFEVVKKELKELDEATRQVSEQIEQNVEKFKKQFPLSKNFN